MVSSDFNSSSYSTVAHSGGVVAEVGAADSAEDSSTEVEGIARAVSEKHMQSSENGPSSSTIDDGSEDRAGPQSTPGTTQSEPAKTEPAEQIKSIDGVQIGCVNRNVFWVQL